MSTVRVVIVQVEGSVEDVVQVCEQLRLSLPEGTQAPRQQGTQALHSVPRSLDASVPPQAPTAPPKPAAAPVAGSIRDQRRAATADAEGARDVVVPPHPTQTRRPSRELMEDLAKVIPEVGDTVRVNNFARDPVEKQMLKNAVNKHGGDPRFKWLPGIAGGARPARIRRERP